jgi:hypothetical protein
VRRVKSERVHKSWTGLKDEFGGEVVLLSARDYRLMRAVVRAADVWRRDDQRWIDTVPLVRAIDAFNAKGKGRGK